MAKVELKAPIIDEIKGHIDGAASVVVVNYCGLTVEQDTKLRKSLREAGVVYKVYKNTFLKRAFEGTDFAQLDSVLEGPTAVAISKDDATAPARILADAMKGAPALVFKAGVVEGTLYDEAGCKVLATIWQEFFHRSQRSRESRHNSEPDPVSYYRRKENCRIAA